MPDTTVQLGDFTFANYEVPEEIAFGGSQKLNVHELIGGIRIIDAMGETPKALEWSGIFVGSQALDRALQLDAMRKAGQALSLTWSELSYQVVIRELSCSFQRFYRLPYRITCEVVSDDSSALSSSSTPSADDLISDDLDSASSLATSISDPTLSGLMSNLTSAYGIASPLSAATQGALASVMSPLEAVRAQVGTMMTAADGVIDGTGSVGGIIAGGDIVSQVAALAAQTSAVTQLPNLLSLDRTLGRVASNIGALNSGTKTIMTGGNLLAIAAQQYGDPMGWTALAQANDLSDPELSGIAQLIVPPFSNDTGGVLSG